MAELTPKQIENVAEFMRLVQPPITVTDLKADRFTYIARALAPALALPEVDDLTADESRVFIETRDWFAHVAAVKAIIGEE